MDIWMWVSMVLALVTVAAASLMWSVRRGLTKQLHEQAQLLENERLKTSQSEEHLEGERRRATQTLEQAARLPDALDREKQANILARELEGQLRDAGSTAGAAAQRLLAALSAIASTKNELSELNTKHVEQSENLNQSSLKLAISEAALKTAQSETRKLTDSHSTMETARDEALEKLRLSGIQFATVSADCAAAVELAKQSKDFVENAKVAMRSTFVEAASSVFDEKSAVLDRRIKETGEQSKARLEETLKPFAENVAQFRKKMEDLNDSQTRDSATLQGAIGKLQDLNQNMASATGDLTRALKGNSKIRGDWGEMILATVLQNCGLEEGVTYHSQSSTKDEETGQRRQPDVVVNLPDGRKVVVDSKVNLIAWADATAATTTEDSQAALMRHTTALRAHVKDLAEKNYPKVVGDQALELTVLFVPIEGALAAALSMDPNLQIDAFGKRIAFASPNTLMALLQVVERLWQRDTMQKQIGVINDEGAKLIDSLTSFLADFAVIEERITSVSKAYDSAKNRLNDSSQSVVKRAQRLVNAGLRGKKALPDVLQPDPGVQVQLLQQD